MTFGSSASQVREVVFTITSVDFMPGTMALANSLDRSGYQGALLAYLPEAELGVTEKQLLRCTRRSSAVRIELRGYKGNRPSPYNKPFLAIPLLREARTVVYFDSDIVLKAKWEAVSLLAGPAMVLVRDEDDVLDSDHPVREVWRAAGREAGLTVKRKYESYVNSGFFMATEKSGAILDAWARHTERLEKDAPLHFNPKIPWDPFRQHDQDLLNAALECVVVQPCLLTRSAMDFVSEGYLMHHAAGRRRPWQLSVFSKLSIKEAETMVAYATYLDSPYEVFSLQRRFIFRILLQKSRYRLRYVR